MTLVVVAVLLVPPLRVMWHAARIPAVYGDSLHIEQALEAVPGALDDALTAVRDLGEPHGWGPRRWIRTWRTVRALQVIWQDSPAAERPNVLIEPDHPDTLGLTLAAVWACVAVTLLGPVVALVSLVALATT